MKKSILLFFLLVSCNSKKSELKISFYPHLQKNIWIEKNYKDYCDKKEKNEIKITFPLISAEVVESLYSRGKEILALSSECDLDIISLTPADLENISLKEMTELAHNDKILATNIYSKKEKNIEIKKHYELDFQGQKTLILSVIANDTDPSKPFYISDFRIEKPQYEINKLILKKNYKRIAIILHTANPISYEKNKTKKYFSDFLSALTKKPEIIFANIDKNFVLNGVKIIGYGYSKKVFSFEKKFAFFEKIRQFEPTVKKSEIPTPKTDEIATKTVSFFSKKLTVSLNDIEPKKDGKSPMGELVSYAMFSFLKSDLSIFDNNLLINGIKKGDVKVKDIYSLFPNEKERLVYIKTRGENLIYLLTRAIENDSSVYFKGKVIYKKDLNGLILQPGKTYRIIAAESSIRNDTDILNHITEFSILNVKLIDAVMWYSRTHKLDIIKEKT